MIIKIKLNDFNFRYDIYQIVNIFYCFSDIQFVEENYDYNFDITNEKLIIGFNNSCRELYLNLDESLKEQIKRHVFLFFTEITGKSFPWGTLIGIRPSKIALTLLKENFSEEAIIDYYKSRYLASEEKAKLCIEVAKYEARFVNKEKDIISVYIGMPFCPTRCSYCSFASNPIGSSKRYVRPYLEALKLEIREMADFINNKKLIVETVYFGGGTPTSVSDDEFHDILQTIYSSFVQGRELKEFTVESGRPDSITLQKLKTMKEFNVNRISINPQTMNDKTLKLIGRNHTFKDVIEKFSLAREIGFDNINMDLIVGLPGEGEEEVHKTCEEILKLSPESITVHGMSIKRASRHHEELITGSKGQEIEQSEINSMFKLTKELSESLDMKPYYMYRQKNMVGNMENVGYAKTGRESIYNIQMMEEKQTIIALGADAVSKIVFIDENRIERFGNVKDVNEYILRIDEMIQKKKELLEDLY